MAKKKADSKEETKKEEDVEIEVEKETSDESSSTDESVKPSKEETEEISEEEKKAEEEPKFEKRFTQFKGESAGEYLKNLEEGYHNSTTEGVRLNQEVKDLRGKVDTIAAAVANDPSLAEKLDIDSTTQASPIADPALSFARQERDQKFEQQYNDFVASHQEMETDPTLREKVITRLGSYAQGVITNENRYPDMKEGLNAAWATLDRDNSEEETLMAAKDTASKSRTTATAKKAEAKREFNPAQLKLAEKLGLTPEQLAKYNK